MRGKDVESLHLFEVEADVALGKLVNRFTLLGGAVDHLVVNVREVFDKLDLVAAELEVAPEDVEYDRPHGMADVGLGVGREAADVHPNHAVEGGEFLNSAREGAVELHWTDSRVATARAAMPSRLPVKPRPSVVLAFTLTDPESRPR